MVLCNNHRSSRACSARSVFVIKMNCGFVCLARLLVWPFEGEPSSMICSTDCIECMRTIPERCSYLLRFAVAFDGQRIWGAHESNCPWKYGKQGASWEVPLGRCLNSSKCRSRAEVSKQFYSFWSPSDSNSTICVKPGYLGRFNPNFSSIVLKDTVNCDMPTKYRPTNFGMNLPPRKCLPLNDFTPNFGAVKLTSTSGCKPVPSSLPFSTSHPLGMSTETIGNFDWVRRVSTESKGALTGGWNEKPKTASKITSESERARRRGETSVGREGVRIGIDIFWHWVASRCRHLWGIMPASVLLVVYLVNILWSGLNGDQLENLGTVRANIPWVDKLLVYTQTSLPKDFRWYSQVIIEWAATRPSPIFCRTQPFRGYDPNKKIFNQEIELIHGLEPIEVSMLKQKNSSFNTMRNATSGPESEEQHPCSAMDVL